MFSGCVLFHELFAPLCPQVVALFALVAAVAALPAPVPVPVAQGFVPARAAVAEGVVPARGPAPKDDLKGSESVYLAAPYVASYPAVSTYTAAAVPAYSTYSAYPAALGYNSYGYGYAAAPVGYYYR